MGRDNELTIEEARRDCRCPYRQDLEIICFEDCGKGNASDCPIWRTAGGTDISAFYKMNFEEAKEV